MELEDRPRQLFQKLPLTILQEVFQYVGSFRQQRIVLTLFGKATWLLLPELEGSINNLTITEEADANALLLYNHAKSSPHTNPISKEASSFYQFLNRGIPRVLLRLYNVRVLNLGKFANDAFLEHLQHSWFTPLPLLRELSMVGAMNVTDIGLQYISAGGPERQENFCAIDITFCRNTTYNGTLPLRRFLPNLKLVRRQPEWLDGQFHTPFVDEGPVEIHTYYSDGTFTFSRNSQSTGFVCDLYPWDESNTDYLGDKLQYNNFNVTGWPRWFGLAYRPGVSLLRLKGESAANGEKARVVMVSQYTRGLRPPNNLQLMEKAADILKIGESKHFDHNGNILRESPHEMIDAIMISKMKIEPLPNVSMFPPPRLLKECKQTSEAVALFGKGFLDAKEQELQNALTAAHF